MKEKCYLGMKGKDFKHFWYLLGGSFLIGIFILDEKFNQYSELVTFISIMIGFKITSLSIIFNSPIKKELYDRKISIYETELHRLRSFFWHSLIFEILAVFFLIVFPVSPLSFSNDYVTIEFKKAFLVFPILVGVIFCFFKIFHDLLKIFVYPTNY